jgi:hypothetical protein
MAIKKNTVNKRACHQSESWALIERNLTW